MKAFRQAVGADLIEHGEAEAKKLSKHVYAIFNKDRFLTDLKPIISPLGCISSRHDVYSLRLDDMPPFEWMIYNFFEIDDIQVFGLILVYT